jgi:hypothetical protein
VGEPPLPHDDRATCRLNNGAILTVLIVQDGERYFQNNFAGRHGPVRYFYRDNWVVAGPASIPQGVVETIRRDLKGRG